MIQRKQTLYLLIVIALMVFAMALPLGKFLVNDDEFVLRAFAIFQTGAGRVVGNMPLAVLAILAAALPLVTIFLYKRRLIQIRLCFSEFILLAGFQGFIVWYLLHAKGIFEATGAEVSVVYSIPAIFPLVSIIFVWLALRGIMKDEALIRSMNRIR